MPTPLPTGPLVTRATVAAQLRDLGWTPTVPLGEGIRKVYQWIEAGAPDRSGY